MKKTKFTEQQIAVALKQAETGTRVEEVCCKMGNFRSHVLQLEKKYGGLGVSCEGCDNWKTRTTG